MPIVLPKDSRERTAAMLAVLRGETVTFERDGVRHTLTPDAGTGQRVAEKREIPIAAFLLAIVFASPVFAMGIILGREIERSHYQREAVKHNAARYNPETAAFEWNQPSEVRDE